MKNELVISFNLFICYLTRSVCILFIVYVLYALHIENVFLFSMVQ